MNTNNQRLASMKNLRHSLALWLLWASQASQGFITRPSTARAASSSIFFSSTSASTSPTSDIVLDKIPADLQSFFQAAANATSLRGAETSEQAHDAFRYEWGTWVDETAIEHLMNCTDQVRLLRGVYERVLGEDETSDDPPVAHRYRVAGGTDWDIILHFLPQGTSWAGRWPGGSWAIVKTLTGLADIESLSGPDRDGNFKVRTAKSLRGGSDGSLAGGQSSAGDDAIKYVGGPLRRYTGKYGNSVLLECVIRPPVGSNNPDMIQMETLENLEEILSIAIESDSEVEQEDEAPSENSIQDNQPKNHLGAKIGMTFENVGGLDAQLDAIARRVLASRANPAAARRLGISHVRGVLLSGPPGCGKTLLARELARLLGAREPQIVNGPEILDKFIGEAEKKVRSLFEPAEAEYKAVGDNSALHIIILDEMDAIARKRGTMTSDTTGVRDSVVNQLLAKMDGVREANNVLVVGLTNRPELLDPALLRPGRLEVQLRVELPDLSGRRDILRIHTRRMREVGGLSPESVQMIENLNEDGIPARTEHFSGAELAGLIRSAASFALGRTLEMEESSADEGVVLLEDIEKALREVRPALGAQDEVLKARFPLGISPCSESMRRVMRDLKRFTAPIKSKGSRLQSLFLVGSGGKGGAGASALAAWAASEVSTKGDADYVRFVTALDLLASGGSGDEARAGALVEKFAEAKEMPNSLLVLDDVDQLCAGSGPDGYSSVMLATLRALLRSPPASQSMAKAGGHSESKRSDSSGRSLQIIATSSRPDAACNALHDLFDETIGQSTPPRVKMFRRQNFSNLLFFLAVVPVLSKEEDVAQLLSDTFDDGDVVDSEAMAGMIIQRLVTVGCKTAIRLVQQTVSSAIVEQKNDIGEAQLTALSNILDDFAFDEAASERLCEVRY